MKILWVVGLALLASTLAQSIPRRERLNDLPENDEDMSIEEQREQRLGDDDFHVEEQREQQDDTDWTVDTNSEHKDQEEGRENKKVEEYEELDKAQYQQEIEDYFREEKKRNKNQIVTSQNSKGT